MTREVYVRSPVRIVLETVTIEEDDDESVILAFEVVEGELVDDECVDVSCEDLIDVDSGTVEVLLLVWTLLEGFSVSDTLMNSSGLMELESEEDREVIFDEG